MGLRGSFLNGDHRPRTLYTRIFNVNIGCSLYFARSFEAWRGYLKTKSERAPWRHDDDRFFSLRSRKATIPVLESHFLMVCLTAVICQTQNLGSDLNFGLYRSFGTLKS